MRRIRLPVSKPPLARCFSKWHLDRELGLDDGGDDVEFDEHPVPGEAPLQDKPRYDWRTRASSRRRPGGLIDPPHDDTKVYYPRRYKPPPDLVQPGLPWFNEIENYGLRFLDLLAAEQETEENLIRTRLANWPEEKLKRDGYCLTGLSAFWLQSNQFGKPVAAFLLGPGIALPYHRFENGTQVLLSRLDPLNDKSGQGSVIESSETEIRISFDRRMDLGNDTWRLDLFNTDIAYERMRAAIQHLHLDPAKQERASSAHSEAILQGTHLRDVLLRSFASAPAPAPARVAGPGGIFTSDQRIASWARRHGVSGAPTLVEGDPELGALNTTQRRAIAMMLSERVSLVQGPPGTGKTKTIIEAVKLLKVHFQVPHPLLVCTYTNVAVDNLVEGLAAAGVRPLRVGFSARVRASLLEHTLDAQKEKHALKPLLDKLDAEMKRLRQFMENVQAKLVGVDGDSAKAREHASTLSRMEADMGRKDTRHWAIQREMTQDIVNQADVICTTCITSATSSLGVTDFPVVFLDEASMSTEPASLIPIMKGSQHLALIGDHKQLPPVITSRKAKAGGLGVSLFERLTEEGIVPSIMLNMQYRMHPSLSRFPSSEFYNYALLDGTEEVSAALQPPASSHLEMNPVTGQRPSVIFLDHAGNEEMKDRSRVNYNEARIVCAVIEDLLQSNPTMMGKDIGIIAPYAAQISLLGRLLKTNAAYREQLVSVLGPLRAMQAAQIEVKTVDGFEGREKEVIIFSTVRNNAAGHIGFLGDRRRMNVGLTRAKRGLFVVGSVGTLKKKEREVWNRYVEWLVMNGAVKLLRGEVLQGMLRRNIVGV